MQLVCLLILALSTHTVAGEATMGDASGAPDTFLARLGLKAIDATTGAQQGSSNSTSDGADQPVERSQGETIALLEWLVDTVAEATAAPAGTFAAAPDAVPILQELGHAARSVATTPASEGEALMVHLGTVARFIKQLPGGEASFPAVRRAVVAALVLRRLRHGAFRPPQERTVQRLLQQLWTRHRAAARAKGIVEFAHVSKSGGTTFCQLAERNGCATESFAANKNCEVSVFRDQPRYVNGSVHVALRKGQKTQCDRPNKPMSLRREFSCAQRKRMLLEKRYTIYANEYTAMGGRLDPQLAHSCGNMLTVLQMRHPHSRMLSHIRHVWGTYLNHCGADRDAVYFSGGHEAADWLRLLPAPLNNYLVRSLLGEKVFNLPASQVTEQHLALARTFLAFQYDVLLVLEDADLSNEALSYGLGWGEHELHVNAAAPDSGSDDGLPSNLDLLYDLNRLDVELYRAGVVMAQLDAIVYDSVRELVPEPRPAPVPAAAGAGSTVAPTAGGAAAAAAAAASDVSSTASTHSAAAVTTASSSSDATAPGAAVTQEEAEENAEFVAARRALRGRESRRRQRRQAYSQSGQAISSAAAWLGGGRRGRAARWVADPQGASRGIQLPAEAGQLAKPATGSGAQCGWVGQPWRQQLL
ncbi:hypothetical protein HXX76_005792 [Chlamydomonas incerta]|uniref:Uncharacterized protein n=1 Tax=Chlamydomonas incerta TaxID=51695 RepID=A0A835TH56_CHLIN|nr:hypothetical protein HXX76_005792 [Chlamydomonas incerta]|eukprot:KAG2438186.1 hypothetical protein HXX76_005792 [Chlamydomonas incerta]